MEIASLKQRRCKDTSFAPFAFKLLAVRSTGRVHGIVDSRDGLFEYEGSLVDSPFLPFSRISRAAVHKLRYSCRQTQPPRMYVCMYAHALAHAARTLADVSAMSSRALVFSTDVYASWRVTALHSCVSRA